MRETRLAAGLVAAAALLLYLGALRNGFAYDDVPIILGDPRVRGTGAWGDILTRPYWPEAGGDFGLYRPLVTLSFALDWRLASGAAAWFHAVDVFWHAAASVLVFLLLRRFFSLSAALAGALLFVVHPVHVEAVANVVGRAELMAATFVLSAALVWMEDDRRWRVATTALLFAAAVFTKESAVMLPALLVLLDFATGRWQPTAIAVRRYLREQAPALAAWLGVVVLWAGVRMLVLGGVVPTTLHPAAEVGRGPLDLFRTALLAWPQFVRLLFFPVTLLADYGPRVLLPADNWTRGAVLGLTILVAVVGLGTIAMARGWRRTALAVFWFPVALLPASNLLVPIGTLVAERTLYLPSVSVAVAAAALWQGGDLRGVRPAAYRGALALVLLAFAWRTAIRVPDWRSTEAIFAALERDRPDAYRAVWYRARVAKVDSGAAAAHADFLRAVELWPYRKGLIIEAMTNAVDAGAAADARALALHAARSWPADAVMHRLLAATALDANDTATAVQALGRGLALDPTDELLRAMQAELAGGVR